MTQAWGDQRESLYKDLSGGAVLTLFDVRCSGTQLDNFKDEMKTPDKNLPLGILTDEEAMYDLLTKFLSKEGYETQRVSSDAPEAKGLGLVIMAPTRNPSPSRSWFDNLKRLKPTVLIVQCCDEDYADVDNDVVLLKDRPLNLKQLSATVKRTLEKLRDRPKTAREGLRSEAAG